MNTELEKKKEVRALYLRWLSEIDEQIADLEMRQFNCSLLTYRDKVAPGYEFQVGGRNYYFFTKGRYYGTEFHVECVIPDVIYFPEQVALELYRKLNSGEVIL